MTLLNAPQNDLLEDGLGVCVSKSASMGAAHILEVLPPAVKVAVLHKVCADLDSVAVWDLRARIAHRLSEQKVRLLRRYNANIFTQERRSWAFPFVGNGPIVSSMEVVVLKVIGKLGNCLDGVVVGQSVCRLPEGTVPPCPTTTT